MTKFAFGITSSCIDGNHIYMGDVDHNIQFKDIYEYANDIMKDNLMSNMIVLKTANGYNLMSLDKIPLKMVHRINEKYKLIDKEFNDIAYFTRRFYVLRMGIDKSVSFMLYNYDNPVHIQSNAHRIFVNSVFGKNINKTKFFDDYDVFQIIKFKNTKYGWELI